jgi:hypothetical protein
MDIEELSKAQLLMLMLLVNFVTSIATGILTVSLLDQAPANVTQTVNRIVDHTIETIATSSPLAGIVAPPVTITKTIIQNSTDQLPAAVAAAASRSVLLYDSAGTSTPVLSVGTYLPKARAVVVASQTGLPNSVVVAFPDGSSVSASLSHTGATITVYGFGDKAVLPNASSPILVMRANLKAGETVVALTSDGSAVAGIISKVDDTGVHTNLPLIPSGNSAVDLSGNVVGISSGVAGLYFPADKITTLLNATTTPAALQ